MLAHSSLFHRLMNFGFLVPTTEHQNLSVEKNLAVHLIQLLTPRQKFLPQQWFPDSGQF